MIELCDSGRKAVCLRRLLHSASLRWLSAARSLRAARSSQRSCCQHSLPHVEFSVNPVPAMDEIWVCSCMYTQVKIDTPDGRDKSQQLIDEFDAGNFRTAAECTPITSEHKFEAQGWHALQGVNCIGAICLGGHPSSRISCHRRWPLTAAAATCRSWERPRR